MREAISRIRRSRAGNLGMGVADNWMYLRRVELSVYADNEAVITLYSKFGFENEGLFRDYAVLVNALSMPRLCATPKAG